MSERPFMQLYVSDFIGDTLHLSAEEIGAYMLLLMATWNAGGKLPKDDAKLARVVRLSVKKWRGISDGLMAFFETDGDTIWNNRLTNELQKSERKSELRAYAGARGGAAKALKDNNSPLANASGLPQHLPDPITREESPHTPLSGGDAVFDREVWAVFPRHLNSTRSNAKAQYDKLSPADQADCRAGVAAYRADHGRAVAAGRAPTPKKLSTWIAKRGWEGLAKPANAGGVVVIRPDDPDFEMVMAAKGGGILLSKAGNINISADELEAIRRAVSEQARAAA